MRGRRRVLIAAGLVAGLLAPPGSASAGFDGDSHIDLFFARDAGPSGRPDVSCEGDGTGTFACDDINTTDSDSWGVAAGDLNQDGFVDIIVSSGKNDIDARVCMNPGDEAFTCTEIDGTGDAFGVAIGDVTGDGDLDVVLAIQEGSNLLCTGNGSGGFACSAVSADSNETYGVAVGDLDGDGDLDIVFTNQGKNRVCLNDGALPFPCSDLSDDMDSSWDVALGDLDGNGTLDAVVANGLSENLACINDGIAGFTCGDIDSDNGNSYSVALGDADNDGDLDAFIGNFVEKNRYCEYESGSFTCSDISDDTGGSSDVALGDFDEDGLLDAVFANGNIDSKICLNDGDDTFTCADVGAGGPGSTGVAIAGLMSGLRSVGLVDPAQGLWYLRDSLGGVKSFFYGNPGDIPFMGDWDCDGVVTPGLYRQSDGFAYLRNSNSQGNADLTFFFGNPGDVPIVGDFNNDGCDTLSIYRPSQARFYIINALGEDGGGLGAADFYFDFGNPGDQPFAGDFDGDGFDEVGLHRATTGLVYFEDGFVENGGGGQADHEFFFGNPGDRFVTGDWNQNGTDSPAVFRPGNTTFYFRYTNTQGNANEQFFFGSSPWLPVSGNFGLGP